MKEKVCVDRDVLGKMITVAETENKKLADVLYDMLEIGEFEEGRVCLTDDELDKLRENGKKVGVDLDRYLRGEEKWERCLQTLT